MADLKPIAQPTRLTGRKGGGKGGITFEMWVEVEGKPLEVYGITEGEEGILEGWIISEVGKVSVDPAR
jgi:hypothetical protein